MNIGYKFANEKFSINSDVYFTVDTTVIDGHRICQLKTLKIYYYGELFEMDSRSPICNYIITNGLRPLFSVELINYLNKLINYENLYEVYSDKINPKNLDSKITFSGTTEYNIQEYFSSFIIHDNSNEINTKIYKTEIFDHRQIIRSELDKLRNPNFPICYSSFEDIKIIPIFCYVHPSLAINQGNTIILCHIGYILEKLANYKRFPEFNTQAIISFMNIVNEASRNNLTTEKLNNIDFKIELEKKNFRR